MGNLCGKSESGQTHRLEGKYNNVNYNNTGSSSANGSPKVTKNRINSKKNSKRRNKSGSKFYDQERVDPHKKLAPSLVPQKTKKTTQVIDSQPRSANTNSDKKPHRSAPKAPFSNKKGTEIQELNTCIPGQVSRLPKEKHPMNSSALDIEKSCQPGQNFINLPLLPDQKTNKNEEFITSHQGASYKEDSKDQVEYMECQEIDTPTIFSRFNQNEIFGATSSQIDLGVPIPEDSFPQEDVPLQQQPSQESEVERTDNSTAEDPSHKQGNTLISPICRFPKLHNEQNVDLTLQENSAWHNQNDKQRLENEDDTNKRSESEKEKSKRRKERRQTKECGQNYSTPVPKTKKEESRQIVPQGFWDVNKIQHTRLIKERAEQDNQTVLEVQKDDRQHGPDVVPKNIENMRDPTKNQEEDDRRESKPIIETKKDEPLQILDVHQYFRDDFDLNSLDNLPFRERIHQIHTYAETFDTKVKEFEEEKYSLEYFVLDEKLMRLIEKLDKIKCQDNADLTKEKVQVISYIKQLHATLDERAKEET